MPASLAHQERMLRHLEDQERAIFARAAEQVDRVIGPKRLQERLQAIYQGTPIKTDSGE